VRKVHASTDAESCCADARTLGTTSSGGAIPWRFRTSWTDPRYRYFLVQGSDFHRRFAYLQSYLLAEKFISTKVDIRDILDASIIAAALKATPAAPG
jgi:hypothetical protein